MTAPATPRTVPAVMKELMFREQDRALREFVAIVEKWPEWREWAAYALLGSAVATCDSLGCDPEGWIAELRRKQKTGTMDIPSVLVPPTEKLP